MERIKLVYGSPDEVGVELQKNWDRMVDSTKQWAEILNFEPSPQTGITPKSVVWRKNKAKLYRYVNHREYKYRTPILFIYALINKAYILDLAPGMSLIEHLVNEGYDVYLLEWGDFNWEDRNLGFGDFVFDYIRRAVLKVCQYSMTDELSICGYCMGGTMSSMYAALFPQPVIRNLVLLAAPINFAYAGMSTIWLDAESFDVDRVTDTFQLIPKDFIDIGVKWLRPVSNFVGTYTRLWKSIDEGVPIESWKALNKWVNDNVNMPGEAYRQWIKDMYQDNKLINDQLVIKGNLIKLGNIDSSLLVMAGTTDHLVLPHQTRAILDRSSSLDKQYRQFDVGHGGLVFGSRAKKQAYPEISRWLAERSNRVGRD